MNSWRIAARSCLLSLAALSLMALSAIAQDGSAAALSPSARSFPVETRIVPRQLSAEERLVFEKSPLGSRLNPVRCFTPGGERRYLDRLRCPGGSAPSYERTGQDGIGPYGTALDAVRLRCEESRRTWTVFMDMSHRGFVEKRPVPGLFIVPARDEEEGGLS